MKGAFPLLIVFLFAGCQQPENSAVHVVGAMRDVMMRGDLTAHVDLDSMKSRKDLFGIGPADSLHGELMIDNGIIYRSVVEGSSVVVYKEGDLHAPFFVYGTVANWKELLIPDSVRTLPELDAFLDVMLKEKNEPFAFTLKGIIDSATFHVVDVPPGTPISSPSDVNSNQQTIDISRQQVRLVGFFSRNHKGVFTHHDSQVHIHLVTSDEKLMGHLDDMTLSSDMKLFVPL